MRLKMTTQSRVIREKLSRRRCFVGSTTEAARRRRAQLYKNLLKLMSEPDEEIRRIKIMEYQRRSEHVEVITINYSENWISISVHQLVPRLSDSTEYIQRRELYALVINKRNMSKSFSRGKERYSVSKLLMILSDDLLRYLGIDWMKSSSKMIGNLLYTDISNKAFIQAVRGYITNPTLYTRYWLSIRGHKNPHLDTYLISDHTIRYLTRYLTDSSNIVKIINSMKESYETIRHNSGLLQDYADQLKLLKIKSSVTTYKSLVNHHNELSMYISKLKFLSENRERKPSKVPKISHPGITLLSDSLQFLAVGEMMNNCVYSNGFQDKVDKGTCLIALIETSEEVSLAEIRPALATSTPLRITQHYGRRNKKPSESNKLRLNRFLEDCSSELLDHFRSFSNKHYYYS